MGETIQSCHGCIREALPLPAGLPTCASLSLRRWTPNPLIRRCGCSQGGMPSREATTDREHHRGQCRRRRRCGGAATRRGPGASAGPAGPASARDAAPCTDGRVRARARVRFALPYWPGSSERVKHASIGDGACSEVRSGVPTVAGGAHPLLQRRARGIGPGSARLRRPRLGGSRGHGPT